MLVAITPTNITTRPSSKPRPTVIPPLSLDVPQTNSAAVAELLEDAAHLINRASRQLRFARQNQSAYALQSFADEIHEHIRQLPPPRNRRLRSTSQGD